MKEIGVAESIFGDKCATRCETNALTAHAQTLVMFETHGIGQTPSSLERYVVFHKNAFLNFFILPTFFYI